MAQMHPLGRSLTGHALAGAHPSANVVPLRSEGAEAAALTDDLYTFARRRGYHFPRELITRYLLALASRRFAMFTGISGTGKTKLALLAAEYFAQRPGTRATRWEQPVDGDHEFFLKIDKVTLRSGTIQIAPEQIDYFNVPAGSSEPFTANITNVLGAHGDITFRATSMVVAGSRNLSIQVPSSVRRAFEETGVTDRDYLRFEIVEEFKRYRVSLVRPASEQVDVPPEDRYVFISVRPSWHDHTALLGHWDANLERYVRTPLLELLLRAAREERDAHVAGVVPAPYFVILDEMNLAKIEHYFSDFLSVLESRRADDDGAIRQETMHLHGADAVRPTWLDQHGVEHRIEQRLAIPTNVVFTGTLNLDESTHPVSPKVMDRAHIISFNSVDYEGFLEGRATDDVTDPLEFPPSATRVLDLGSFRLAGSEDSRAVAHHLRPLVRLNELLVEHDQHSGYRTLNDIGLFVRGALEWVGDDANVAAAAVDAAVAQKVLPKFHAWRSDRGGLLAMLLVWALDGDADPAVVRTLNTEDLLARVRTDTRDHASHVDGGPAAMPRTAGRLVRMLRAMG